VVEGRERIGRSSKIYQQSASGESWPRSGRGDSEAPAKPRPSALEAAKKSSLPVDLHHLAVSYILYRLPC